MEKKILELCSGLCSREILMDEELVAAGVLDSFRIIELVCSLEEQFHITIGPEEISEMSNFSTVSHIAGMVNRLAAAGKGQPAAGNGMGKQEMGLKGGRLR